MRKRLKRVAPLGLALVSLLAFALPAWAINDQRFTSPRIYDATVGTAEVVTADFNNDGDLDLVSANGGENDIIEDSPDPDDGDISFIPGNGDGTFGSTTEYDSAREDRVRLADTVTDVIAADLDGDGNMDLAMTDTGPEDTGEGVDPNGRLVTMLGDGNGNFVRVDNEIMTGSVNPVELVAADFDGEGDLEIAVANAGDGTGGTVTVLRNSGGGNFTEDTPMLDPVGTEKIWSIGTGDFNEDGEPDLVATLDDGVTDGSDDAFIYQGAPGPSRAFTEAATPRIAVGERPTHVISADFDDEGSGDIATANNGSDNISVATSNGDGTFDPAQTFATGDGPYSLAVADFNVDGKPDLAAANAFSDGTSYTSGADEGTVSIFPGKGDGSFDPQRSHNTGDSPIGIVSGFFNDDDGVELPDIATANFGTDGPDREDGSVAVLLGRYQCDDDADNDTDGKIDFAPTNGDLGCESITDNTESPNPATYTVADVTVAEGNSGTTSATFTVTRNGEGITRATTVDYATEEGSGNNAATEPSDYTQTSGTLNFAAGETSKQVTVPVKGDTTFEGNENFKFVLSNASAGSGISDGDATGTINNDDLSQCNDGTDNDSDGKTDFGGANADPGCEDSADDSESPDPPTLSITDVTVTEGNSGTTNATFTVTRSGGTLNSSPSTVDYATQDGTATQPEDYAQTIGALNFAAGETSKQIQVPVKGDTTLEPDETFRVDLSNPTGATIQDGQGTGTISNDEPTQCNDGIDNDGDGEIDFGGANSDPGCESASDNTESPDPPTLSIDDVTVTEGDTGTTNATFTVTRSGDTASPVTATYTTSDGTATQPADYAQSSGQVSFAADDTSETITVPVNGDETFEPDETFNVDLSNPSPGARISDGEGVGTIQNDEPTECNDGADNDSDTNIDFPADPGCSSLSDNTESPNPPTLSIDDVTVTEGDTGTKDATFTVTRSGDSTGAATVRFATANGTATSTTDYTARNGTLTFAAGDTSKTIAVPVRGDVLFEPDETFNINLSAPTGATITDGQGAGTIANNDNPECSDTRDNDGDGKTDFGGVNSDPGCESASDNTESPDPPVLAISDVEVNEGDAGTTNATFTVTRSGNTVGESTVQYATADGAATQPADYTQTSGTLTFAANDASETVTVPVKGDTTDEPNETFRVDLSNPTGATIGDGQGTGTIRDDDLPIPQCNDGIDNDEDGKTDFGGANGDPGCESATDDSESPDPPSADLALDLDDTPDTLRVGQVLTYKVTVSNDGPSIARGVDVENILPKGVTFLQTSSQQCNENARQIICSYGDIAPGDSEFREIKVRVNRAGTLEDRARIFRNSTDDPDASNDSDTETTTSRPRR